MKKSKQLGLGIAMLLASAFSSTAAANQIQQIKEKGELVCGTLGVSRGFSFVSQSTRQLVGYEVDLCRELADSLGDRKSTRLNFQSLMRISYAVFCLKKKKQHTKEERCIQCRTVSTASNT